MLESLHIYPWEILCVVLFAGILFYFRRQRAAKEPAVKDSAKDVKGAKPAAAGPRKAGKARETPEEMFMDLRRQALETTAGNLALQGELKPNEPWGALMEMGIPSSVVTLACFADGNASLYYKTGGGMIGGISHENVRKAAQEFTTLARKALPRMRRTATYPLPEPDKVRFYVLTSRGIYSTETDREALGETESELSALFSSGQEVVAQMREVQEQKSHGGRGAPVRPAPAIDEPTDPPASSPSPPADPGDETVAL
jgi:hypothetical protein